MVGFTPPPSVPDLQSVIFNALPRAVAPPGRAPAPGQLLALRSAQTLPDPRERVRALLAARVKAPVQGLDADLRRADAMVNAMLPRRRGGKR